MASNPSSTRAAPLTPAARNRGGALTVNALTIDLAAAGAAPAAPGEFRVLPLGEFKPADGRQTTTACWTLSAQLGAAIVDEIAAKASDTVIDYEHQSLRCAENGQPAPAAGWFGAAALREDGLYAVDVRWTDKAKAAILAGEYRYVSPVFLTNPSGEVVRLINCALTNTPGLDGLCDLNALSARFAGDQLEALSIMDELIEQLRWMLDMPVGSTAADIVAQLDKIKAQITAGQAGQPEALRGRVDLAGLLAAAYAAPGEVNALKAQLNTAKPDPAQYVEIGTVNALRSELGQAQTDLNALRAQQLEAQVNALVDAGLREMKLAPAMQAWATDLGKSNLQALKSYLDNAPAVISAGTQTGGKPPAGAGNAAPGNETETIRVNALRYQKEQANAGHVVTWAQAVEHVAPATAG
jgi:phage I-like protein